MKNFKLLVASALLITACADYQFVQQDQLSAQNRGPALTDVYDSDVSESDRRQIINAYSAGNRVVICHVPPGNPDARHTITISRNALPAHLSHGSDEVSLDHLGECVPGEFPPPPTEQVDGEHNHDDDVSDDNSGEEENVPPVDEPTNPPVDEPTPPEFEF